MDDLVQTDLAAVQTKQGIIKLHYRPNGGNNVTVEIDTDDLAYANYSEIIPRIYSDGTLHIVNADGTVIGDINGALPIE